MFHNCNREFLGARWREKAGESDRGLGVPGKERDREGVPMRERRDLACLPVPETPVCLVTSLGVI